MCDEKEDGGEEPPTGRALDMIASDFLAGRIGEGDELVAKLDMHITNIERAFGVKLEVVTGTEG